MSEYTIYTKKNGQNFITYCRPFKDIFYEELKQINNTFSQHGIKINLGDMNVKIRWGELNRPTIESEFLPTTIMKCV